MMKHLKKFEGFSNSEDLSEDIVYSLLDLFDEYSVEEITDDSYDNYLKSNHPRQSTNLAFKSDSFIYTSIIKDPNEIGQWESPKRFHRSGYKNGINYLIIYSNGYPGSQFQEVIEKSIERLNKIYDVKLTRNNENSVTQILDKTTLEIKKLIPCRTWVIEIYEK